MKMPFSSSRRRAMYLTLCAALVLAAGDGRGPKLDLKGHDEAKLKKDFDELVVKINGRDGLERITALAQKIKGLNAQEQVRMLQRLGDQANPRALAVVVPFLDSQDLQVRVHAGLAVSRMVERDALRRRDPAVSTRVVLKPLGQGELDLRPLAWVVLKMLRQEDDGNTHAYAASMIRYLELQTFKPELRQLLRSRHPAVSNAARWALDDLDSGNDPTKAGG
jgi:hypothetical protein